MSSTGGSRGGSSGGGTRGGKGTGLALGLALAPNPNELLQLPGVTDEMIKRMRQKHKVNGLRDLVAMAKGRYYKHRLVEKDTKLPNPLSK